MPLLVVKFIVAVQKEFIKLKESKIIKPNKLMEVMQVLNSGKTQL